MNWQKIGSQVAHYLLAGLGVVLAGLAAHITQGDLLTAATAEHWAIASIIVWLSSLFVQKVGPTPGGTAAAVLVLLALLPLASCSPPAADGAAISVMSLGDTATIAFHWPAVNKATGYSYTITAIATNGTWVGLPTAVATTATSGTAIATSATADTAVFQLCATATGPAGSSAVGCSASVANAGNTWRRRLASPQPVLDSVKVSIVPNPITVPLASSRIVCAFHGFKDGQVAERTADKAPCDSLYQTFPAAQRTPSSIEQVFSDTATWGWSTTNPAAVGLVQQGVGSSAVLVQGNSLTMLGRVEPLERYAASTWPVYRIDSTYVDRYGTARARVTCLRPGIAALIATSGDARTEYDVICKPHPWEVRLAADALYIRPDMLYHRA